MLVALSRFTVYKTLTHKEKGMLLDVLCKLESLGGGFFVDKKMKVPLDDEQIAELVGLDMFDWVNLKVDLVNGKILKWNGEGLYCPLLVDRVDIGSDSDEQELALWTLNHWNSKGIQKHNITASLTARVTKLIKKYSYTDEQLEDSINNYATVLKSPDYFWTKKWALVDFLSRGVDRFVSDAKPLDQFRWFPKSGPLHADRSIMSPKRSEEYNFEGIS